MAPVMRLLLGLVLGAVAACSDDQCGPHMHYLFALGVCACDDNAIADGGGCTACADDEVVVTNGCSCPAGEAKVDGTCAPVQGLGSPCDATTACSNPTYGYCAMRAGVGSCSNLCATDADCTAGYVCADWEATPSCRMYTGYGASCTGTSACAGFDADLCVQGTCAVHDCTVGLDDCPRDTKCCDFTSYGLPTLCVPPGYCP